MNINVKPYLFFFIFALGTNCKSQNLLTDISLLRNKDYTISVNDHNHRSDAKINNTDPIKFKHKNFIAKYNPFSLGAAALMLFYQHIVSPELSRRCLYQRSCSNFSKAAIKEFGLIKGVFMSADRLLRCNFSSIEDIPPDQFDDSGYAIDEPEKYLIRKK